MTMNNGAVDVRLVATVHTFYSSSSESLGIQVASEQNLEYCSLAAVSDIFFVDDNGVGGLGSGSCTFICIFPSAAGAATGAKGCACVACVPDTDWPTKTSVAACTGTGAAAGLAGAGTGVAASTDRARRLSSSSLDGPAASEAAEVAACTPVRGSAPTGARVATDKVSGASSTQCATPFSMPRTVCLR
jgi:hypothetical protein